LIKNLVENAINYAPHNGFVDLQVLSDERGVLIRISDNGPGIPYIERKRVFDPFFRISGTELPGSGLGLSIVKAIADRNRIQ
ncbi:sensor histidine kinase, partial [Shewanella algae]|uniref:sensor histidine kinase n=1 Tax=Shewanella algae TaxID=38313 RepID=UPI00313D8118